MSRRLNLLALPKKAEFMRCFVAPPGQVLFQWDVAALEPHVLCHLSQDPTLMAVYGPGAWPSHDIYLLAGQQIPGLGDEIRKLYDFKNPTEEGVRQAKIRFAKERKDILKKAYLSFLYGIGADALAVDLEIPVYEARAILKALNKQFPGKKSLQMRLETEWSANGGFIVNGRGRPLPVDFGKKHDLVNRVVQSTGHDCLVRILYHLNAYRKEHKIQIRPYCPDIHDESVWCGKLDQLQGFQDATEYAFAKLNEELSWSVKIRHGGIGYGPDLRIRCDGWSNDDQRII